MPKLLLPAAFGEQRHAIYANCATGLAVDVGGASATRGSLTGSGTGTAAGRYIGMKRFVRLTVTSMAPLRNAVGEYGFESAWAEGAALATDDAIAYILRGPRRTQTVPQRLGIANAYRSQRSDCQRRPLSVLRSVVVTRVVGNEAILETSRVGIAVRQAGSPQISAWADVAGGENLHAFVASQSMAKSQL